VKAHPLRCVCVLTVTYHDTTTKDATLNIGTDNTHLYLAGNSGNVLTLYHAGKLKNVQKINCFRSTIHYYIIQHHAW